MKLTQVKSLIEHRIKPKWKLPPDDVLEGVIHEAMHYICSLCDPAVLVREPESDFGDTVLRYLPSGYFIAEPEYPDVSDQSKHLQIDESLTYAVINYSAFILSGEVVQKRACDEYVAIYIANSTDADYEVKYGLGRS